MTQSPNKTGLNASEMPSEIFIEFADNGNLKMWKRSYFNEGTRYVRIDLVEKMKVAENG